MLTSIPGPCPRGVRSLLPSRTTSANTIEKTRWAWRTEDGASPLNVSRVTHPTTSACETSNIATLSRVGRSWTRRMLRIA
jgi:hypothetical protein